MKNSTKDTPASLPARYQIKIKGKIREDWSDWLSGMVISAEENGEENLMTVLTGGVTDQAALRGILCKIWDLNLTVLSVSRIEMNAPEKEGEK